MQWFVVGKWVYSSIINWIALVALNFRLNEWCLLILITRSIIAMSFDVSPRPFTIKWLSACANWLMSSLGGVGCFCKINDCHCWSSLSLVFNSFSDWCTTFKRLYSVGKINCWIDSSIYRSHCVCKDSSNTFSSLFYI